MTNDPTLPDGRFSEGSIASSAFWISSRVPATFRREAIRYGPGKRRRGCRCGSAAEGDRCVGIDGEPRSACSGRVHSQGHLPPPGARSPQTPQRRSERPHPARRCRKIRQAIEIWNGAGPRPPVRPGFRRGRPRQSS